MKKIYRLLPVVVALTPMFAFAAAIDFTGLIQLLGYWINLIVPFLIALATLLFIWGVITYITAAGDAEKRKIGQDRIVYGLIGLFVLVAFWGIITFITGSLGLPSSAPNIVAPPTSPAVPY